MKSFILAALVAMIGFTEGQIIQPAFRDGEGPVQILGAAYGPADVTNKVREIYNSGIKKIYAKNEIFGDPWFGVFKSLHVSYRQ